MILISATRYTYQLSVNLSFAHWTGKPGGGCSHGPCSQSWPWWKFIAAKWCNISYGSGSHVGRRLWVYTRRGAIYVDFYIDRREFVWRRVWEVEL